MESEQTVPLIPDAMTDYAFQPGNGLVTSAIGVLGANGQSIVSLFVPNLPYLAGLEISFVFLTIGAADVDGLAAVSPRYVSVVTL